jgi:hypothetical protein
MGAIRPSPASKLDAIQIATSAINLKDRRMGHGLYVLYLSFKLDLELVQREYSRIGKLIHCWALPILHGNKSAGFVIETDETLDQLSKRLRPMLNEIDPLDNYWICPAPAIIESKNGGVDPFYSRLAEGWDRVRQRRQGKYMAQRESR